MSSRHRKEERRRSQSRSRSRRYAKFRQASPTRRVHLNKSSNESARNQERGSSVKTETNEYYGKIEVHLAGKSLSDDDMRRWCREDGPRLISKNANCAWDRLDLSRNNIGDEGVSHLVRFLQDRKQAVVRLMLFMNKLVEPDAVCRLIEDSELGVGAPSGLSELHLSSNSMTLSALRRIIESVRRRALQCGPFRQPVWLRAERNPSLENEATEFAKGYWSSNFKICLDGGRPESGCSLSHCRYNADVHLHLFGANRANRHWGKSWQASDRA
jgi:hypothetical protein